MAYIKINLKEIWRRRSERGGSRDGSVGIATRYGLEVPGIESRCGEIFRTYPDRLQGPTSILYNGYRLFPGDKGGRSVMLTTHPLLVPRLRKRWAIPPLTLWVFLGLLWGSLYFTEVKGMHLAPCIAQYLVHGWFIKICQFLDHLSDTQLLCNSTAGTSLKICYSFCFTQYHNICYCCTTTAGGTETLCDMHSHAHQNTPTGTTSFTANNVLRHQQYKDQVLSASHEVTILTLCHKFSVHLSK
jgi:hypothetical protein